VRARYADFGPTLAREKLIECHGLSVSTETLRKWMTEDGLWVPHARRRDRVYQARRRRDCVGELIQIDGCDHDWFEERAPRCVLLVYVDDATSRLMQMHFCEAESTFEYFEATRGYIGRFGKPVAFYSDKATVFRVNASEPRGGDGVTQFGRAMSDLNVDIICANSAPATLRDRGSSSARSIARGLDPPFKTPTRSGDVMPLAGLSAARRPARVGRSGFVVPRVGILRPQVSGRTLGGRDG